MYVRIEIKMGSEIENIIHCPRGIYFQTGFAHEVTAMNNIPSRDHSSVSVVQVHRPRNDMHTSEVVRLNQGGEPFHIC